MGGEEVVGYKEMAGHEFKAPKPFHGSWVSFWGQEGATGGVLYSSIEI